MSRAHRLKPIKDKRDVLRRLFQISYLLLHQYSHWRYIFVIKKTVPHHVLSLNVFLRYKYIGNYLARDLSRPFRRKLILSHYGFVQNRIRIPAISELVSTGIELWHYSADGNDAEVILEISRLAPMEGEWQMRYNFNGQTLSTLSFCFASTPQFCLDGDHVCLIGGFQGGYDCRTAIRLASKANGEISPSSMLILAIKALATALGLTAVYGVSSEQHVARSYAADSMMMSYDRVWIEQGAARVVNGFFCLSDAVERQLGDIGQAHRRRAKRKRLRKAAILAEIELKSRTLLLAA